MTEFDSMVGEIRSLTVKIFNKLNQKNIDLEAKIAKLEALVFEIKEPVVK